MLPFGAEVSIIILCPLAQPNKAVGLESHIGSWLAMLSRANIPACAASRAEGVEPPSDMKPRTYNLQRAGSGSRNMQLAHSIGIAENDRRRR